MKLHCFVCTSPLYLNDYDRDRSLHQHYLEAHQRSYPQEWVFLSIIQNGCEFPTGTTDFIRNPIPKNIAYNWLLCDANCREDYWLFLPEDCQVSDQGWLEIRKQMEKGVPCFALSKDPKAFIGRRGTFADLPEDLQVLCDMNFLGKEIGGAVLRGVLEQQGFHCITKEWRRISDDPKRWGNALYAEMNVEEHPYDVNKTRSLPILQDYGLDGWKAPVNVLESTFMAIIDNSLKQQKQAADRAKSIVCHHGPLITELPFKGMVKKFLSQFTSS